MQYDVGQAEYDGVNNSVFSRFLKVPENYADSLLIVYKYSPKGTIFQRRKSLHICQRVLKSEFKNKIGRPKFLNWFKHTFSKK